MCAPEFQDTVEPIIYTFFEDTWKMMQILGKYKLLEMQKTWVKPLIGILSK
jgi:hypothetical protein